MKNHKYILGKISLYKETCNSRENYRYLERMDGKDGPFLPVKRNKENDLLCHCQTCYVA